MELRNGKVADASAVAVLHAEQIGEGFLSSLGPKFLARLYRRVPRVPDSFLLVLQKDARVVGFLAGSLEVRALYREFLVRDGIRAAFECAGPLARSPRRVFETLRHGTSAGPAEAELLAVAVHPEARRSGGGTMLVEGFQEEIARRGRSTAHVVVASENDRAVTLYRRTGFAVVERFELHRGSESLLMRYSAPGRSIR